MISFDLGGYGAYVWPAYAAAAIVLVALLLASLRRVISTERRLARLQAARLIVAAEARVPQVGQAENR